MKKAGIGSRIAFDANIQHLQAVGLIRETIYAGEHAGNEFEVFTVEEIASQSNLTSPSQKLDGLVSLETSQIRQRLNETATAVTENLKPFFKTLSFINDEAPHIAFVAKSNEAAQAATGKDLTEKDLEASGEIAEIIINETTTARSRTKSVSIYLKFAAENLRRRLYAKTDSSERRPPANVRNFAEPVNGSEPERLGAERELIL